MSKEELWKKEGYSSHEEWKKAEKQWIENAKNRAESDLDVAQAVFNDPGCKNILGI